MRINGFLKTTLLDYPGHLASTIFLSGCNFLCPFCHNKSLVINPNEHPSIDVEEVLANLNKRKTLIEGVCITGGEPTLQSKLPEFISKIKSMDLKVKLDTNGYRPSVIKELHSDRLIDYVAMDIKNSPEKYQQTVDITNFSIDSIYESVDFLLSNSLPYEFRTTVVRELHSKDDFEIIGKWLANCRAYFLQSFKPSDNQIRPGFSSYNADELNEFIKILTEYIPNTKVRGE